MLPSARQVAMPEASPAPELESSHVNEVVVPSAFFVCDAVMVGAALSTRTVTEPTAPALPRRSVCAGAVRVVMPLLETLSASTAAHGNPRAGVSGRPVTVTLLLFHPLALAAGCAPP